MMIHMNTTAKDASAEKKDDDKNMSKPVSEKKTAKPESKESSQKTADSKKDTSSIKEKPAEKKEVKEKKEEKGSKPKEIQKGDWGIIEYPHLSEKSIANVESQNKIIFIVKQSAKRSEIKKAVEKMFDVKVAKVNMLITTSGKKKAYVRLKPEYSATDIATRLGMM